MADPGRADYGNLIAGAWRPAAAMLDNRNPSDTREVVGRHAAASAHDVDEAIAAARAAFKAWSRSTPQQRADLLDATAGEILARRDELGRLLAREEGKTLAEATGEVVRAGHIFRFQAGQAVRLDGGLGRSTRPGVRVEVTRQPVGVVGLITPWNFPIAIPAWKLAPALAYGNTVVLKPSELAPASAWAMVEILHRNGLPAGVVNLVQGQGAVAGRALSESPGLDALSFTGSVPTGEAIARAAAGRKLRLQLELGGKNPLVVLDDADLDRAVDCALNGAFFSTGQRCTASSRLIVTEGIHDRFVAALRDRVSALRIGHALAADTQIGPAIDERQLEKNLAYVELGRREGARLVVGGEPLKRDTPGHYLAPALFVDGDNAMRLNREEVFGPVACVIRVRDYEQALEVANDTRFGLCAGICTRDLGRATHFREQVEAGVVMVNLPTAGLDYHVPFGGLKASSFGPREQGEAAAEFYTVSRTAYVGG